NEIFFDAPEIILSLRISETEDSARVSATKDMRNAVGVTINCCRPGEPFGINQGGRLAGSGIFMPGFRLTSRRNGCLPGDNGWSTNRQHQEDFEQAHVA